MSESGWTRNEMVTLAWALAEFRDETGPGKPELAERVNTVLRGPGENFVIVPVCEWCLDSGLVDDYGDPDDDAFKPCEHCDRGRIARLQRAVDRAHGALTTSAYVGGPNEREAWQTALRALSEVATQHQGKSVAPFDGDTPASASASALSGSSERADSAPGETAPSTSSESTKPTG